MPTPRFAVRLSVREHRPLDPGEIYYLEAEGDTTLVRLRGSGSLLDTRPLGEIEALLTSHGLLRIHRNHMVNLARVRIVRRRDDGDDWEIQLDPPVNRVLPISRSRRDQVLAALGVSHG